MTDNDFSVMVRECGLAKAMEYIRGILRDNPENRVTQAFARHLASEYGEGLDLLKTQPKKLMLEAVKKNWRALEHVRKQSEEVCLAAIGQDAAALQYVRKQTKAMHRKAFQKDRESTRYWDNRETHPAKVDEAVKRGLASSIETNWRVSGLSDDVMEAWIGRIKDDEFLKSVVKKNEILFDGLAVSSGLRCSAGAFRRAMTLLSRVMGELGDDLIFAEVPVETWLAGKHPIFCRDVIDCGDTAANRQIWVVGGRGVARFDTAFDTKRQPFKSLFKLISRVAPGAAKKILREFLEENPAA